MKSPWGFSTACKRRLSPSRLATIRVLQIYINLERYRLKLEISRGIAALSQEFGGNPEFKRENTALLQQFSEVDGLRVRGMRMLSGDAYHEIHNMRFTA
ncbi:hypothetical protein NDS46_02315 [Paenibacillus thiaminolyticus]|uniref:hypothetical protein n=1 Tax=Paenibacillus thiaminolyticus TaxID=49283 RepID=UPI00232E17C1|nr:hypothetical protein [Paenibacillus thiaminolyticus]WCF08771.1 hypothetical protein NDS46_02315 [Paenibacillus thiaminolyticus]